MNEVIVALITGILTFAGVVVTVIAGNRKTEKQLKAQSDLTLYRIGELEKKQDKHNGLIDRMYHAEEKIAVNEEQIKVINHRIEDLEHAAK
ncbi:MAG: hypothetical protein IKT98_03780 [Selenomonadaceae bacterium]|nr:hypothetical protein [Selenomonadaceae bacterium]